MNGVVAVCVLCAHRACSTIVVWRYSFPSRRCLLYTLPLARGATLPLRTRAPRAHRAATHAHTLGVAAITEDDLKAAARGARVRGSSWSLLDEEHASRRYKWARALSLPYL
jgi:hypothetical protein